MSIQSGLEDLYKSFRSHTVWSTLAWDDIKSKYHRTVLGPIWIVLAQALWMGGIVVIFAGVFKQDVKVFSVYLAAGLAVWVFISTVMTESVTIFMRAKSIIESYDLPISMHIFRTILSQLIILAHHMIIYVVFVILFYNPINLNTLLIIPALLILTVFALGVGMILGVVGARYRDVQPAIQSLTSLLFIFTPIFWQKTVLGNKTLITDLNIVFHLVEIFRAPLMGETGSMLSWGTSSIVAIIVLGLGAYMFSKHRTSIYYWI